MQYFIAMTTSNKSETERIYNQIENTAKRPKTLSALKLLKEACDLLDKNSALITIASVGRFTESIKTHNVRGGLRAGSIRNNKLFCSYINARMNEQQTSGSRHSVLPCHSKRYHSPDMKANALLAQLESERDQIQSQYQALKRYVEAIGPINFDQFGKTGKPTLSPSEVHVQTLSNHFFEVPNSLLTALRHLMDPTRLAKCGLKVFADRLVSVTSSAVLLDDSDLTAIKKSLGEPLSAISASDA